MPSVRLSLQRLKSDFGSFATNLPEDVRRPFIESCLWLVSVGGTILLIAANVRNPNFDPLHPVMLLLMALQAWVLTAAIWKGAPNWFRALSIGAYCMAIGGTALFFTPPTGGIGFFLLSCTLLIGLLFGHRALLGSFSLVILLYVVAGYGWVSGYLPPNYTYAPSSPREAEFWLQVILSFVIAGGVICSSVFFLIARLTAHHTEEKIILKNLAQEQTLRAQSEFQRLRSETALVQAEKEKASMLIAAPVGIILVRDRTVIQANPQISSIYGYAPTEVVGMNTRTIYANEAEFERVGRVLYEEMRVQGHGRIETIHRRRDGEIFPVLLTSAFVDREHPEKGLVGTVTDISTLKKAESALRDNESRLREIFDNTREIIFAVGVTADGRFLFEDANAALELHGLKLADFRAGNKEPSDLFPPESAGQLEENYRACVETRMPVVIRQDLDLPMGRRQFSTTLVPVLADDGLRVRRIVGFAHDITDVERASALERSKAAADAASRAKSAFIANMSHEIRTPMNAILGFAQLMRRNPHLTREQQEHLAIINRNGEHLLELINDILEISKIEASRAVLRPSAFSPGKLIGELAGSLRPRAEQKGLRLDVSLAPDLFASVTTDELKVRQILLNLASNALKFTEKGEVKIVARSALSANRQGWLHFEVCDTGPGISADELKNLFQNFEQTDLGRKAGGAGLGLAISKDYARLMGGEIKVESELGFGAKFCVSLPVQLGENSTKSAPSQDIHLVRRLSAGQSAARVLIVDDTPDNRLLMREMLEPIGFETKEAGDGEEAVRLAREWNPTCILMDMRMPKLNGIEAIRLIRAMRSEFPPTIISLSASVFPTDEAQFRAAGADDFVAKPVVAQALLECMCRHLCLTLEPKQSGPAEAPMTATYSSLILPSSVSATMREAAEAADFARIQELIEQISPGDHPLVRRLQEANAAYDYEALRAILSEFEST